MPYSRVLIHTVWTTKDRKPCLTKANKDILCTHIKDNATTKKIHIINVNGWLNHLHCLIVLSVDQNISTVMQLIKGESSYWANKNLEMSEHFGWQDEYFAVSISESHFEVVNNYINNQEVHHQKKTFQEEYDEFIAKYKFEE